MGCKIERSPDVPGLHKRASCSLARPNIPGLYEPVVHHACTCNELIAIRNRVCGLVPLPTVHGLLALRRAAKIVSSVLPEIVPDPYGLLPALYSGPKRARYERATERVRQFGMSKEFSSLTMFIKNEKVDPTKFNPDPRAIQFRDARYCVAIARFLKPIEGNLYRLTGGGRIGCSHTRLIGKGLNQVERAIELQRKLSCFSDPAVVSIDMSRFDQHVSRELLQVEHSVYLRCCHDAEFAQLLAWQLDNLVYTRSGFKYRTRGKRMSGDMNTALGNCLLMVVMVVAFFEDQSFCWDMFDDGDDCLLIVERSSLQWVLANLASRFLSFGHEAKIERVSTSLSSVSWCHSSPIVIGPGIVKFVRDPFKTMSADIFGTKWINPAVQKRMLTAVGYCELVLNVGVPVLEEYALALLRAGAGEFRDESTDFQYSSLAIRAKRELRVFHVHALKDISVSRLPTRRITDEARLSFYEAFGVSVDMQIAYEERLRSWTIVTGPPRPSQGRSPLDWDDPRFPWSEVGP